MSNERQPSQVLIVEDQPELRKLYRNALECLDVEIFDATDGVAAAEVLDNLRPQVVVTDLMMPRMDGFELCSLITTRSGPNRPEVIAISGKATPENVARIRQCGARACLSKPVPIDQLINEVQTALEARSQNP